MNPTQKAINASIRRVMLARGLSRADLAREIGCSPKAFTNLLIGIHVSAKRRNLIEEVLNTPFWSSQDEFNACATRRDFYGHEIDLRDRKGFRSLGRALGIFTRTELRNFTRKQFLERFTLHAQASVASGEQHMKGHHLDIHGTFSKPQLLK